MTLRLPPIPAPIVSPAYLGTSDSFDATAFTEMQMIAHERAVLEAVAADLQSTAERLEHGAPTVALTLMLKVGELRAAVRAPSDVTQRTEDGGAVDAA